MYLMFLCGYSIHQKAFYSSWDLCSNENNDWNNRMTLLIYFFLIYTPYLFNKISCIFDESIKNTHANSPHKSEDTDEKERKEGATDEVRTLMVAHQPLNVPLFLKTTQHH